MHGGHQGRQVISAKNRPSLFGYPEIGSKQSLRAGCPEADNQLWMNHLKFCIEPGPTCFDFAHTWFLMKAPLPAGSHLKCFTAFVIYTLLR